MGPVLLDVEAIAMHYRVAEGSVGRWASEDRWTPYGTRRHRLWDLREAQPSYDRRHPKPNVGGGSGRVEQRNLTTH